MKVFIGLTLLSVAFALPALQPISLPEPAVPEMEMGFELPNPEFPTFEAYEVPSGFQRPDIRPVMIPMEVIEALRMLGESPFDMPADTVQIVEVAENLIPEEEAAADAVIFVDHVQEEFPLDSVAEDVSPVNFVDEAENIDSEFGDINPDAAVIVEHISFEDENIEVPADPVKFVDVAENEIPDNVDAVIFVDHAEEPVALDEEAPINGVVVVDDYIPEDVAENEIAADPVRFVDEPIPADVEQIVSEVLVVDTNENPEAVKIVDAPLPYPPKYYDNPLLRTLN